MKKSTKITLLVSLIILLAVSLLGCASIKNMTIDDIIALIQKGVDAYAKIGEVIDKWDEARAAMKGEQAGSSSDDKTAGADSVDGVDFALLQWKYGGVDHSGAQLGVPRLANPRIANNTLSYTWVVGLSDWKLAHDDAGAVCSLFIQLSDGSWVGGKFDWVSTSRPTRGLKHINGAEPYKNWGSFPWSNTPKPTKAAFVVTREDGGLRSNVIVCDWAW